MAFVALIDANALVPARLRGLLVDIALHDLYAPAWTQEILEEAIRATARAHPDLDEGRIRRNIELLHVALPQAMVTGYEGLVASMKNDEGDRHVLAAAVRRGADTIVTGDRTGFDEAALGPYTITTQAPDEFLVDLWDLSPTIVLQALQDQANRLINPPYTVAQLLDRLAAVVPRFASAVQESGPW